MSVARICSRVIATASPNEAIWAAAQRMALYDVGTLVVLEGGLQGRAVGIVTDRDIAIRCVAQKLDPDRALVSEVMTTPVQAVDQHTPIGEAVSRMANAGTRRLLVTDDVKGVVGVLSMDDVLGLIVEQTAAIGRLLERQKPLIPA